MITNFSTKIKTKRSSLQLYKKRGYKYTDRRVENDKCNFELNMVDIKKCGNKYTVG